MVKRVTSDEREEIKLLKVLLRKTKSNKLVWRSSGDNEYYAKMLDAPERVQVRWYATGSVIRIYEPDLKKRDVNRWTKAEVSVDASVTEGANVEKQKIALELLQEIKAQMVRNATKFLSPDPL